MATFYVSPTGDDTSNGTSAANAFSTLARAQAAMRASPGPDTAVLPGGTYTLDAPLVLTGADNGSTFTSAAGQTAVLSGGGAATSLVMVDGASNITLNGLGFIDTAGGGNADSSDGAVSVVSSSGITVSASTFTNVALGVAAHEDAQHVTVSGSTFTDTWGPAIAFTESSHENTASNNTILRSGSHYTNGGAIELYETWGNLVSHNTITNVPRHGIEEQNWDPGNKSGGNTIEYNSIAHSMQQSSDGGAIYLFSGDDPSPLGSTIQYNRIEDVGSNILSWGIYLDDFVNNAKVVGNFVNGGAVASLMVHGGDGNEISNNVLINGQRYGINVQESTINPGDPVLDNNIHHNLIAPAPGAIFGGSSASGSQFHDNVYAGDERYFGWDGETFAQWQSSGGDAGSDVVASADLVNPTAGDYSFASGAFALTQGIVQLPLSLMGALGGGSPAAAGPPPASNPAPASEPDPVATPDPDPTPATESPSPTPPDDSEVSLQTLTLQLSGDNWRGAPQFTVTVDGEQVGSGSVTASHRSGDAQSFSFSEMLAGGEHEVAISFVNDAFGGTALRDRNLWVEDVVYNGQSYAPQADVSVKGQFVVTVGQ